VRTLLPFFAPLAVSAGILASWTAASEGGNSITSPDTQGNVGWHISLALDGAGNPVLSYTDVTNNEDGTMDADLKLMHCNDPDCADGDESITSPDTSGVTGFFTSLRLDPAGNPVVAYSDRRDLRVLHCNDPNCIGGDESMTSAYVGGIGTGAAGYDASLVLDAKANPVISFYHDYPSTSLKVTRCNDPNCAGGDESTVSPDSEGVVGLSTSLALDAAGRPVVSYYDSSNFDLKLLHCDDPDCSGGGESINSPDTAEAAGWYTSLVLDTAGNPVISYYDSGKGRLRVMHCNEPNCVGGDESITLPDQAYADVGRDSSLTLDALGNPVVSYFDGTEKDLKLLHCNDPNCTGADESIVVPDAAGMVGGGSLVLDAQGRPLVAYYDGTNGDVKLLHCGDPNCSDPKPLPTATEAGPTSTPNPSTTPSSTPTPKATEMPSPTPTPPPPLTMTPTSTATPTQIRTATPTATNSPMPAVRGDANCDHNTSSLDAALILQRLAALIPSVPCLSSADIDGDGSVTALDAALILQYVAGLLDSLPP
jgi:hypothetical protein